MIRALVTGANGFVGAALCRHLVETGIEVRATVRDKGNGGAAQDGKADFETYVVGDIAEFRGWKQVLSGVDVVIHAAARAHVMRDRVPDPLAAFRWSNTLATGRLARLSAEEGVARLVYISSVKVNGEATQPGQVFRETDTPCPVDAYALSKLEAEQAVAEVAATSALRAVTVRPALVYGPNVRGNMAAVLSYVDRGIPLPLASIKNARSLVSIDNLCRFLHLCATDERACGQTFLVADEAAVSTPELFTLLAEGMGRRTRLYPMPDVLLRFCCRIGGLEKIYRRLCQSLVIDSAKAARILEWRAPIGAEDALRNTGRWYAEYRRQRWAGEMRDCLSR